MREGRTVSARRSNSSPYVPSPDSMRAAQVLLCQVKLLLRKSSEPNCGPERGPSPTYWQEVPVAGFERARRARPFPSARGRGPSGADMARPVTGASASTRVAPAHLPSSGAPSERAHAREASPPRRRPAARRDMSRGGRRAHWPDQPRTPSAAGSQRSQPCSFTHPAASVLPSRRTTDRPPKRKSPSPACLTTTSSCLVV
eukprot:scaffold269_cov404-Prasinococcus_capsulatus_cf.AAC.31